MKNNKSLYKNKNTYIILLVFTFFVFLIIGGVHFLCTAFELNFEGLIYSVFNETKGTSADVIISGAENICPYIICGVIAIATFVFVLDPLHRTITGNIRINNTIKKINITKLIVVELFVGLFLALIISLLYFDKELDVIDYFTRKSYISSIFEEYYVNPEDVVINKNGETKNLIYIYLEGMDTAFLSKEKGGQLQYDCIPNLYSLAQDNINFSQNDSVGGYHAHSGSLNTVQGIFSSQSAVPYKFPVGNHADPNEPFATKVTLIGDILKENGYYQEFLCGSDSEFGGRKTLFNTHGFDKIYDYYTAVDNGEVDYYVWWGYEDETLYKIAKQELLELANKDQPFNFTMLTVDTHQKEGYVCDLCEDNYEKQFANVMSCADNQVYKFIEWIKQQDFYENTMIVITGDHPSMDGSLVNNVGYDNRYVYNCFINADGEDTNTKNRNFCTLDIMPTVLSGLGFDIEGDRIGLGVNLFSGLETLEEKLGYDYLEKELSGFSEYFEEFLYDY